MPEKSFRKYVKEFRERDHILVEEDYLRIYILTVDVLVCFEFVHPPTEAADRIEIFIANDLHVISVRDQFFYLVPAIATKMPGKSIKIVVQTFESRNEQ